ncbi:hypothetical protein [Reinekea sp.]|jgi:hypothetical protein|uniref:hypothetical protein n=1 Tax=Reinekea sp. TaxID=1970455 RepID=UPI002A82BBDB|nr:hypothetical protein [Reinekea sp.]
MAEQQYDLFFSGDLVDGFFLDFVKVDIQTLFKASDAYVANLFSGQEQLIKKQVDKTTAIKFQTAFKQAGAKLIVRPHNAGLASAASRVAPAEPVASRQPMAAPEPAAARQPDTSVILGFSDSRSGENDPSLSAQYQPPLQAPKSVPGWDLSVPGTDMGVATAFEAANIDTSGLTVATVGEDLLLADPFESPAPIVNTDSLTLAPVGGLIDNLDDKPAPLVVDISHLHVEPL